MIIVNENSECVKKVNLEGDNINLIWLEKAFTNGFRISRIEYFRNDREKYISGDVRVSSKGQSEKMLLHRIDLMGIFVLTDLPVMARIHKYLMF